MASRRKLEALNLADAVWAHRTDVDLLLDQVAESTIELLMAQGGFGEAEATALVDWATVERCTITAAFAAWANRTA